MSQRLKNALTQRAYAKSSMAETINLALNGQNGYLTDLSTYQAMTDHVRKPLIFKVLRVPVGLTMMPDAKDYIAAYKNIMETMMQSWSGLNRTLSVSVNDTQTGHSGEAFQTPTRVSRARTQLTSTIVEKDRRPIIRFMEDYVRYCIGDPDKGYPLLSDLHKDFDDQLADTYGGIILAYEPDKTFRYAENAFLLTNVFPHGDIGENTASRQLQQDGEVPTYNFSWTCFQKVGYAVDKLAQTFMDANRVGHLDPSYIDVHVKAPDSYLTDVQTGYTEQINTLKDRLITP